MGHDGPQRSKNVVPIYQKFAHEFSHRRSGSVLEQNWLDRFVDCLEPGAEILDLGCGSGEPIASHLLNKGFSITGIDAAPAMIKLSSERFPQANWLCADMGNLDLQRRFQGLIAWDSFFHLTPAKQRVMFDVFSQHADPGARLMFTSGPSAGEVWGVMFNAPLYHASLDPSEYRELLSNSGFSMVDFRAEDPHCGGRTVWLAQRDESVLTGKD